MMSLAQSLITYGVNGGKGVKVNIKGDHIRCTTTEDWEMCEILES